MACRPAPASTESAGPGNCANPATTGARARKADRMDVTLRFSYEAADKIQRPPAQHLLLLRRFQLLFLVNQRNLVLLLFRATANDFDLDLLGGFVHCILN